MTRLILICLMCVSFASPALASGASAHAESQEWSFNGVFGTYDRAALQRGFQVYKQVCASCHSMNRISYRNLSSLGYSEAEQKAIARDYTIMDGPNDEGDMFERARIPSDPFAAPYANEQQARYANNGAFPPDLSLINKARHGGADYIAALLSGYHEAPEGVEVRAGMYYNAAFAGHQIAMPSPLEDGAVVYEDDAPQTVEQYSKDVAQFLEWAAEPHMEDRKRIGWKVMLFLAVFALVMYGVKKKVWADVH